MTKLVILLILLLFFISCQTRQSPLTGKRIEIRTSNNTITIPATDATAVNRPTYFVPQFATPQSKKTISQTIGKDLMPKLDYTSTTNFTQHNFNCKLAAFDEILSADTTPKTYTLAVAAGYGNGFVCRLIDGKQNANNLITSTTTNSSANVYYYN